MHFFPWLPSVIQDKGSIRPWRLKVVGSLEIIWFQSLKEKKECTFIGSDTTRIAIESQVSGMGMYRGWKN